MASITVEEQQAVIKPILETVDGIVSVEVNLPDAVKSDTLPMLVLWPREATYDRRSDGAHEYRVRRRWVVLLLVLESAQGREWYSDSAVKPFLTTIPDKLAAYPQVKLDDGRSFDLDLHQGGDRGADPLTYKKKSYAGTGFTFYTVTETTINPASGY